MRPMTAYATAEGASEDLKDGKILVILDGSGILRRVGGELWWN